MIDSEIQQKCLTFSLRLRRSSSNSCSRFTRAASSSSRFNRSSSSSCLRSCLFRRRRSSSSSANAAASSSLYDGLLLDLVFDRCDSDL